MKRFHILLLVITGVLLILLVNYFSASTDEEDIYISKRNQYYQPYVNQDYSHKSTKNNSRENYISERNEFNISSKGAKEHDEVALKDIEEKKKDSISFYLNDESEIYTYDSYTKFMMLQVSEYASGYVANFTASKDVLKDGDPNKITHAISFLIPEGIESGILDEQTSNFMLQFFGSQAGILYTLDPDCEFTLTITSWEGPGGRATGYFSGMLKAIDSADTIVLYDGKFDIEIN